MGVNMGLLAEYSSIYPDLKEDINTLSKGIPNRKLIEAATFFLPYDVIDHKENTWVAISDLWFRAENKNFIQDLQKRVLNHYGVLNERLAVLFVISSLKLLQLGLEKEEDDFTKEDAVIEIDLFKIYLLLNESFTSLQIRSDEYIKEVYADIHLGLLLLNMSFATSDLINFIPDREFFCQSVKGLFLFDFLYGEKNLQPHVKEFLLKYDVNLLKEYYAKVVPLVTAIGVKDKEGFIAFDIKKDENYESNQKFLSLLSVANYLPSDDIDFRVVRSTPLVEIDKDVFRATHPLFFFDKLYKGLYFELSSMNATLSAEDQIKNFRSFYTTNFSEKYLLYRVMKFCLKNRYIQYTGEQLNNLGIQGAPDYYVRDNKYVFLIENKDILIKASVKENPFFQDIEVELKKKFLDENGRAVGIKQIIANIERVLQNSNDFDNQYKARNIVIYPILIVHDIIYDTPGINLLFNHWFSSELNALKEKGIDTKNVKPLIVLNIDTLIRFAQVVRVGQLQFRQLFEVYLSSIIVSSNKFSSQTHMESALTHRYLPSTKILEDWLFKKHRILMQHNEILNEAFERVNLREMQ